MEGETRIISLLYNLNKVVMALVVFQGCQLDFFSCQIFFSRLKI